MKSKIIICGAIAAALALWASVGISARTKYEAIRQEFNAGRFDVSKIIPLEDGRLKDVKTTWVLRRTGDWSKEEVEAFRLAGYRSDIQGLVGFWSDDMPPFSMTDQERNKLWIGRAALRNICFPERMHYWLGKGVLFAANERYAVVYEDTANGLKYSAYTPTKSIDQAAGGEPTARPESK